MVAPAGPEAYLEQLQGLLPKGRAWRRDGEGTITRLLRAGAEILASLDLKGVQLLADINPGSTTDLIDEWERAVGLPDDCSRGSTGLKRSSPKTASGGAPAKARNMKTALQREYRRMDQFNILAAGGDSSALRRQRRLDGMTYSHGR